MIAKDSLPTDRFVLEWIKVAVSSRVCAEFATSIDLDVRRNVIYDDLVCALSGHVLAEKLPPDEITEHRVFHFRVPASPWQQFKQTHAARWWMRWLVNWSPIREIDHVRAGTLTVNLQRFHAYPQARIMRDLGEARRQFYHTQEIRWDKA